jgi:hypothetical protein
MKRDFETLRKRMDDFYFKAITPEGDVITISREQSGQSPPLQKREGKNLT